MLQFNRQFNHLPVLIAEENTLNNKIESPGKGEKERRTTNEPREESKDKKEEQAEDEKYIQSPFGFTLNRSIIQFIT